MRCHPSFIAVFICVIIASATASPPSPVGTWRVIGDTSGEAEALVLINERDGLFEGKILKLLARPGIDPNAVCEFCKGAKRNQPIQGLTILSGLRRDGDEYTGGDILDPDSGEIYRCTMTLSGDNRRLMVRGFIGISLFGRTQTWLRE